MPQPRLPLDQQGITLMSTIGSILCGANHRRRSKWPATCNVRWRSFLS